jgi:hypothetical protein
MKEEQIADIWTLFKGYIDKKSVDIAAEKFVDLLADYGTSDEYFKDLLGVDPDLDNAIQYYLELDQDIDDDYEEDE